MLDGAGYHRSQEVKDKAVELGITLHYLPAYSPNLNPIERLWKVMNEHARNNKYFVSVCHSSIVSIFIFCFKRFSMGPVRHRLDSLKPFF